MLLASLAMFNETFFYDFQTLCVYKAEGMVGVQDVGIIQNALFLVVF